MPNRDTWDWKGLEPDKTVTMIMLFDRTAKDDGRKEGADYDWHRYPVTIEGKDWTMFTASEVMHSALQALGVDKKGDVFRATKKIDGWNKETQKQYTYYELERDGTRLRTDQMDNQPTETPQQQVEKADLPLPEKQQDITLREIHKYAYNAVMDNILEYIEGWCPGTFGDITEEQKIKLLIELSPHVSAQVCNLVNWSNGGKKG